jgi:hypothetical protein
MSIASDCPIALYVSLYIVHCTVQYVKTTAKIGTPGSAGMLATASTPATTRMPVIAGTKETTETPTTHWMPQ